MLPTSQHCALLSTPLTSTHTNQWKATQKVKPVHILDTLGHTHSLTHKIAHTTHSVKLAHQIAMSAWSQPWALRDCKQAPQKLNRHFDGSWTYIWTYATTSSAARWHPTVVWVSILHCLADYICTARLLAQCGGVGDVCVDVYTGGINWNGCLDGIDFKAVTICRPLFYSSKKTCTAIGLLTGVAQSNAVIV